MNISENATVDISRANLIHILNNVFLFLNMVLVASSIFGNVLIIIVVARDKVTTTSILFGILAGTDMLATCMGPLLSIIMDFNPSVIEYFNSAVARVYWSFASDIFRGLSMWTLVVITSERFLSVTMPFKVKELVTVPRVILAEIVVSLAVLVVHYVRRFLAVYLVEFRGNWVVKSKSETWHLFFNISDWVCFAGIPLIVIMTESLVIWIKLRTSFARKPSHSDRFRSVTINLLMANFTFIITNIPFRVMNMIFYYHYRSLSITLFQWQIIMNACIYLMNLNHALHFYVYIFSGQKFREDVKGLFSSLKMRKI